jgi:hypothetical protein
LLQIAFPVEIIGTRIRHVTRLVAVLGGRRLRLDGGLLRVGPLGRLLQRRILDHLLGDVLGEFDVIELE